jgi:hypothetical protein
MLASGQSVSAGGTVVLVPDPLSVLDPVIVVPLFEINGAPVGHSNTQFGSVPAPTDDIIAAVHGAGG